MTPRKHLLALAFLAGVVAVSSAVAARGDTGAAVSPAASSGKTQPGRTIHLLEEEAPSTAVPIGQHTGLRAGDESVFARNLFTTQRKPAGQLNVGCVATTGGQNWALICTGVYALSGGTLVGTTVAGPSQGPNTLHIAITGGTGRYEGARGSITSAGSKTGFANDTIHLLP